MLDGSRTWAAGRGAGGIWERCAKYMFVSCVQPVYSFRAVNSSSGGWSAAACFYVGFQ